MKVINFKKNTSIQAFQEHNNFGDQMITIITLNGNDKDKSYYGTALLRNTEVEGSWVEFTEKNLLRMLKDMDIKII